MGLASLGRISKELFMKHGMSAAGATELWLKFSLGSVAVEAVESNVSIDEVCQALRELHAVAVAQKAHKPPPINCAPSGGLQ